MKSQTEIRLSQWLFAGDHVAIVVPVTVQIAKRRFVGARYSEDIDGQFAEKLYLVGELPPLYRRSQQICFRTDDAERDWFLTSWFRQIAANTEYTEACPFGDHFILTYYSELESWASRQTTPKLRRLRMSIEEVGPTLSTVIQPTDD